MRRASSDVPAGSAPALRLEPENERVWCGERRLDLTPREFAVLRHLVENAGRLVTKAQLLDAVWTGTVVSEAALTSCIRDLRRALGDSSSAPVYVETVHRRGFRFIGPLARRAADATPSGAEAADDTTAQASRPPLVGRGAELERLAAIFAAAREGQRKLAFVTGEAGIGKTTLVEAFLASLGHPVRIVRGQCVEQFGAGEAYLPVLEVLGRLGRGAGGEAVISTLRRYAPAWLAHLPALLGDEDLVAVQRRAEATTRERSLRELIEAFDVLAANTPLVLVLEDLHWSDSATIDLLAMLARRRDPARLLIVATYRPADVAAVAHPVRALVRELQLHGLCDEIALDFLPEEAIAEYLAGRFSAASFPTRLARMLCRSTSGNPLFLVSVVDDLIARGDLREEGGRWIVSRAVDDLGAAVPHTLRQMVDKQVDGLTAEERALLAVASVAGVDFSAELAAADGTAPSVAEERCDALARQGRFLRSLGAVEWPDGTVAARYGFIHALYQNVLYSRVPIGSRVGLHLRIGDRLERAYGARATEIAGELAMHFERGRDFERAIRYRRTAADAALRRHAHREAADHATRGLALCAAVPESPARIEAELAIHMILGAALAAKGWAAPEVERTYAGARELCARVGVTPERFAVLSGLFGFYITRADLGVADDLAAEMLDIASADGDPAVLLAARHAAGVVALYKGEIARSLDHLEHVIAAYDPAQHRPSWSPAFRVGQDAGVSAALHAAWATWLQGYPERSAARMLDALARARALEHPFTLALACHFAALFFQCRGDVETVRELEEAPAARSTEYGIDMMGKLGAVRRGWLLAEDGRRREGIEEIRAGIAAYRAHGSERGAPTIMALLAEAYGKAGQAREGLAVVAEAQEIAADSGAHFWDAELKRLEGELTLAVGSSAGPAAGRAEAHFAAAMDIARRQGAKLLELRGATSLARLLRKRGETARASAVLADACGGFTEGFATRDLREARELLEALAGDGGSGPAATARRRRR